MTFTPFIDADTHITEPADLWTSRVSKKWGDRVLHVKQDNEGTNAWFVADEKGRQRSLRRLRRLEGQVPVLTTVL